MKVHFNNYFPEGVPPATDEEIISAFVHEKMGEVYDSFGSRKEADKYFTELHLTNQYRRAIYRAKLKQGHKND